MPEYCDNTVARTNPGCRYVNGTSVFIYAIMALSRSKNVVAGCPRCWNNVVIYPSVSIIMVLTLACRRRLAGMIMYVKPDVRYSVISAGTTYEVDEYIYTQ